MRHNSSLRERKKQLHTSFSQDNKLLQNYSNVNIKESKTFLMNIKKYNISDTMLSTIGRFLSRIFLIQENLWHTCVNLAYSLMHEKPDLPIQTTDSLCPLECSCTGKKQKTPQVTQVCHQSPDSNLLFLRGNSQQLSVSKITLTK